MRIIIDTDPGQDDALTVFLALASPEIELLGVTTVAGNVSLEQTTRNALVALDLVGRPDIPVCSGADRPVLRAQLHDPNTVAWLLRPDLYRGRRVNVRIETQSELTMGTTVVDWWNVSDLAPNALVLRGVDVEGVYDLLIERLTRLH